MSIIKLQSGSLAGEVSSKGTLKANVASQAVLKATISSKGTLQAVIAAGKTLQATIASKGTLNATISKAKTDNETVYILRDEAGTEVVGVLVSTETVLTATEDDIRKDKLAVTEEGITKGTKVIPKYYVSYGYKLISPGKKIAFQILNSGVEVVDYTKLQAIICQYAGSISKSTAAEMIAIEESVYSVKSNEKEAAITKDKETHTIDFGVTNTSENRYVVRYVICKEVL